MKILFKIISLVAVILVLAVVVFSRPRADTPQASAREAPPFARQKALFDKLKIREAWEMTKGSPQVTIGIIETGFDFFHPGLKDGLAPGYYAPGGYHIEITESISHGTMVSGLIIARPFPGGDLSGLAPDCKALAACLGLVEQPLLKLKKEFDRDRPGAELAAFQEEIAAHVAELRAGTAKWTVHMAVSTAKAIRYLVDHGVRLINCSNLLRKALIPSAEAWAELDEAFRYAAAKDVLIVLGAGNNAQDCGDYPGDSESVVVVGAATMDDKRWEMEMAVGGRKIKQGSNFGDRLTVMAPSTGLFVCSPHEQRFYACDDGPTGPVQGKFTSAVEGVLVGATSCATPIVTSLAALVMSLKPGIPAAAVLDLIRRGADDIGEPGYDPQTGHGRVNFLKTLALAKDWNGRPEWP